MTERGGRDRAVGSPGRSDEEKTDGQGDEFDAPAQPPPSDEHVEDRARSLEHGGEGHESMEGDPEASKRAADAILKESEERTLDPDTQSHEGGDVPRRTSEETA